MTDLPKLSILLLTYKRTDLSIRTIESTFKNLGYPPDLVSVYVCDDGSPKEDHERVLTHLRGLGANILGHHNKRIRNEGQEESFFAGKSYNLGLGICHQNTDFVLVLENDWELERELDLIPYVKLLQEREDVGAVSFRILSVGADVHTVGHADRVYLKYLRTTQYAFSGNPYIRHARFTKHYGWFAEDCNPGNMELQQDDQYRYKEDERGKFIPREESDGPHIWRPVDISVWGGWAHIGNTKSWD